MLTKEQIQKEIEEMNEWIPVSKIEEKLGMPPTTLQKVLKGNRTLPKKWHKKLEAYFIVTSKPVPEKNDFKLPLTEEECFSDLTESAKKEIVEVPISEFTTLSKLEPIVEIMSAKKSKGIVADVMGDEKYKYVPMELPKVLRHKLWKQGDPREGTTAFWLKYECYSYEELEKLNEQSKADKTKN